MVSPTNKKWGLCSNRRSTRRWANRRPGESRHHHGSVIVAGARPRHLCACHPFVLHVSVARTAQSGEGAVAVHPDGAAHGSPVNPTTFRHSSHGGTCCSPPSGCQARSRQRRWPGGPGFTARWWGADNRTCDQITRTQLLHLRCFAPRSSSSPSLRGFSQPLTARARACATGIFALDEPRRGREHVYCAARFPHDAAEPQAREPRLERTCPEPLCHAVRQPQHLGRDREYSSESVRTGPSMMTSVAWNSDVNFWQIFASSITGCDALFASHRPTGAA